MNFKTLSIFMFFVAGKVTASDSPKPIIVDGSSTVFPLTEAVAEEFNKKFPKIRVSVGSSGTGGGFKKFLANEIQICDASRPISAKELEMAKAKSIDFIVLPVAYDALSVVVSKKNKFLDTISFADLKKIWEPGSKVNKWSDFNASYPKKDLKLFGPGPDSGTFDYFTEHVVGKAKFSRADFSASEDDNILVKGVAANEFALGYFGHAYVESNKTTIRALKVDAGAGPIEPSNDNIRNKTYPLARLLYIYVNKKALERPEVKDFVDFYLENTAKLAVSVGYLNLEAAESSLALKRYNDRTLGL